MRMRSESDSRRVPPVTAERSPPASRITGADSPVIALSSTEAVPNTTSPSPGMVSPASTSTRSPRRRLLPGTVSIGPAGSSPRRRRAGTSRLVERSAAACALPRPSARLSAKFANSSVAHSHTAIASTKDGRPSCTRPPPSCTIHRPVISRLPTSTTNITGLRHCTHGASFTNESRIAWRTSGGSNSGREWAIVAMGCGLLSMRLVNASGTAVPRPRVRARGPGRT